MRKRCLPPDIMLEISEFIVNINCDGKRRRAECKPEAPAIHSICDQPLQDWLQIAAILSMGGKMDSLEKSLEAFLDAPAEPGRRLPTERNLAAQFGATRHAVRKALDQLEAKGRLWRHVGRGTFAGPRQNADPADMTAVVPFARPREIVEVRQVMEPQIAALAALRASSAQLAAIDNAFRKCSAARNMDQYEIWDEEFHRTIAAAAGNILLQSTFEAVNKARKQVVWGAMRGAILRPERRQFFTDQHGRVVEALKARNANAAWEAMRAHIATTAEVYAALEQAHSAGRGPISI